MSKLTPQPDGVARPQPPYSPVVVDGDLVYTAGQVAFDEQGELIPGGIEEQTRQALENLTACLRAGGDAGALAVGLGSNLGTAGTVGAAEVERRCRGAIAAAS